MKTKLTICLLSVCVVVVFAAAAFGQNPAGRDVAVFRDNLIVVQKSDGTIDVNAPRGTAQYLLFAQRIAQNRKEYRAAMEKVNGKDAQKLMNACYKADEAAITRTFAGITLLRDGPALFSVGDSEETAILRILQSKAMDAEEQITRDCRAIVSRTSKKTQNDVVLAILESSGQEDKIASYKVQNRPISDYFSIFLMDPRTGEPFSNRPKPAVFTDKKGHPSAINPAEDERNEKLFLLRRADEAFKHIGDTDYRPPDDCYWMIKSPEASQEEPPLLIKVPRKDSWGAFLVQTMSIPEGGGLCSVNHYLPAMLLKELYQEWKQALVDLGPPPPKAPSPPRSYFAKSSMERPKIFPGQDIALEKRGHEYGLAVLAVNRHYFNLLRLNCLEISAEQYAKEKKQRDAWLAANPRSELARKQALCEEFEHLVAEYAAPFQPRKDGKHKVQVIMAEWEEFLQQSGALASANKPEKSIAKQ